MLLYLCPVTIDIKHDLISLRSVLSKIGKVDINVQFEVERFGRSTSYEAEEMLHRWINQYKWYTSLV